MRHPDIRGKRVRAFHVRRTARERYGIDESLLAMRGDLAVADFAAIRQLAARMNAQRPPEAPGVSAGEIGALGLLHEVGHMLIARQAANGTTIAEVMRDVRRVLHDDLDRVLDRFGAAFPGVGPEPEPATVRLEELLLTRISNENPAIGPLHELVDDRDLADGTRYLDTFRGVEGAFGTGEPLDLGDGTTASLVDLLRAPARHAPTSFAGQLRYVRDHWGPLLGPELDSIIGRLDIALGIIAEEDRALHQRFGGGGAGDDRPVHPPSFRGLGDEPEAFSADSALDAAARADRQEHVRLARPALAPLRRDIRTLDAIPDEALDELPAWGVTGLWLIGLWQRRSRRERIKRMRGNTDAVASAYSLDDYRIADDLGGEPATATCASARGPAASGFERHGAQPHGHRFALGRRAPRATCWNGR